MRCTQPFNDGNCITSWLDGTFSNKLRSRARLGLPCATCWKLLNCDDCWPFEIDVGIDVSAGADCLRMIFVNIWGLYDDDDDAIVVLLMVAVDDGMGGGCNDDDAVAFVGREYFLWKSGCWCWPDADVIGGGLFTLFGL